MTAAALAGFATGFSLILAIGAQNAFVLRQGLARAHVLPVCLVCSVSDAILITAGVAGAGALVQEVPGLERTMRLAGAAFLLWYGVDRMRAALSGEALCAGVGADRGAKGRAGRRAADVVADEDGDDDTEREEHLDHARDQTGRRLKGTEHDLSWAWLTRTAGGHSIPRLPR